MVGYCTHSGPYIDVLNICDLCKAMMNWNLFLTSARWFGSFAHWKYSLSPENCAKAIEEKLHHLKQFEPLVWILMHFPLFKCLASMSNFWNIPRGLWSHLNVNECTVFYILNKAMLFTIYLEYYSFYSSVKGLWNLFLSSYSCSCFP